MKKFVLHFVDCCLPDYFSGHHLPVLQAPVDGTTTRKELTDSLYDEIKQGVLDVDPRLPDNWTWQEMKHAIDHCIFWNDTCKHDDIVFPTLEKLDSDDYQDYCHAFFVIDTSEKE